MHALAQPLARLPAEGEDDDAEQQQPRHELVEQLLRRRRQQQRAARPAEHADQRHRLERHAGKADIIPKAPSSDSRGIPFPARC
jgi:chromatin segregation and condensation protein Rec8/ScpA/Scc1 (kleisin family)